MDRLLTVAFKRWCENISWNKDWLRGFLFLVFYKKKRHCKREITALIMGEKQNTHYRIVLKWTTLLLHKTSIEYISNRKIKLPALEHIRMDLCLVSKTTQTNAHSPEMDFKMFVFSQHRLLLQFTHSLSLSFGSCVVSLSGDDTAACHSKCRNCKWCCSSQGIQLGDADSEKGPKETGSMHSHELRKENAAR